MKDESPTIADDFNANESGWLSEALPSVVILAGPDAGRVFSLRPGRVVIGRIPSCDIPIDDESVSRNHAALFVPSHGPPTIRDLGSTNGTKVNGEDVNVTPRVLADGDRVHLSKTIVLKFSWQDQLEEALQRSLYDSAVRDALTGLHNRRYLLERFEQEFAFASRHGNPLSVLLYDLDHFKKVNDTLGHDAGDKVLQNVARLVSGQIRREDVLGRYGGEEFVLLMRDTPASLAGPVSDRIRLAVSSATIEHRGELVQVTISGGLACSTEAGIESAMDLFVRADRRLYQAKESGRNRIVIAPKTPGA